MKEVIVELGERSYPIYIEAGALKDLGGLYREWRLGERAAIITDRTVEKLYGAQALAQLKEAGIDVQLIPVPPGESSKSLEWLDRLYTRLIWAGFDRDSTIVALGGGVVGDLAGFAAATFLRGIPWVQVPTTLLAQVDASVGGKVGINHRLGKNLIGTFHQPQFVIIDPQLLLTLPERELRAGLSEVIKHSLIRDAKLFEQLEAHLEDFISLSDLDRISWLIQRSIEIKSEMVSADERERGSRALLNFGHTIGHALEAATKYRYFLHGEAVAWGMLGEAWISQEKGLLAQEEFERLHSLLRRLSIPALPVGLAEEALLEYIHRDKKVRQRRVRIVLLRQLGQAELSEVSETEIRSSLKDLQRL